MNASISSPRTGLTWLAAGVAAGILAMSLAGPASVTAHTGPDHETIRSIDVSGLGRVRITPDTADVEVGVTFQGETADEASNKAARTMDAVVKAILELGIAEADIQTTMVNLSPVYDWDDDPPNIEGWQANNMVRVTVRDVDQVGPVVDAAIGAGANSVNGINFRVDDPSEAESVARSRAVADAEAKAQQLAQEAGVNIVGIVTITESGGQPPQPFFFERQEAAFAAADVDSTPILPGEVELTVNVSIRYEIE